MLSSIDNPSVMEAKCQELEKCKMYNVHDEVENNEQKLIFYHWVCTLEEGKVKAHLIARGIDDTDSNI